MSHRLFFQRPLVAALGTLALAACASVGGQQPSAPATPSTAAARAANTADLPTVSDTAADPLLADVQALAPEVRVGLRYATSNNFTGAPITGYEGNHAYLRREAAVALARVARRAQREGLELYVFDAYRPVRATLAMVDWTERTGRQNLIRDG